MSTRELVQPRMMTSFMPVPGGILQRQCSCGNHAGGGECEECKKKKNTLQRKSTYNSNVGEVPSIVHEALRSPGRSLDKETREFMEPRFGHDFSGVRIHSDAAAAESARAVNALAYTVGKDIVFGNGQYRPSSIEGRMLMAHELVHTIQQRDAARTSSFDIETTDPDGRAERNADTVARQVMQDNVRNTISSEGVLMARVPCLPAASCPAIIPDSAEATSSAATTAASPAIARRARMSPARARASGHGGHARQLEKVLDAHDPALRSNIHGIFVDQDFPTDEAAAYTWDCASFTPPITGATKPCVFVPASLNQQALAFNSGAATVGGGSRDDWKNETLKTLGHEIQHVIFDTAAHPTPAGVTCARSTVQFELSEISARISEFPVPFRALPAGAGPGDPAVGRLNDMFSDILSNPKGSISGGLKAMRCKCPCADVDAYVRDTFDFTTSSWTAPEKAAFNTELRDPKWSINWPL